VLSAPTITEMLERLREIRMRSAQAMQSIQSIGGQELNPSRLQMSQAIVGGAHATGG